MSPGTPVKESAAVIATLLDRLHGGADDYTITVPEALLEQSRRTRRLFDIVMGAIAGISFLVGGIGIENIMLARLGVEITCRVYRPRRARESPLFRLVEQHVEECLRVYPKRFAKVHGPLRPVVERVLCGFLTCGIVSHGVARLWCSRCGMSVLCPFQKMKLYRGMTSPEAMADGTESEDIAEALRTPAEGRSVCVPQVGRVVGILARVREHLPSAVSHAGEATLRDAHRRIARDPRSHRVPLSEASRRESFMR